MIKLKNIINSFLLSCGLLLNNSAHADVWVGNDASCDFNTIQGAINFVETGADNTIRIANNVPNETYFENLSFDNTAVTGTVVFQGGYDQCEGVSIASPVVIDGSGTAPVFNINGDDTNKSIVLNNLVLKNGFYDAVNERAGGLNILGDELDVFMNSISINQNTGIRGGGLYVQGTGQKIYLYSANIFNNTARNGGGLACDLSDVFVRSPSAISFNFAASGISGEGNGGGAYLNFGCHMILQSGDASAAGIEGVIGNQASNHGGGVYLATTSRLSLSERDGATPVIKANQADTNNNGSGDGGGIYVTGVDTTLDFRHGVLASNQAANGGGIAANDQANARVFQNVSSCSKDLPCTTIDGNQAGAALNGINLGAGGAMYATNQGKVSVTRSSIINNLADFGLLAAVNSGGSISISASFITDNGDLTNSAFNNNYLMVAVDDSSRITLGNVTVANNQISTGSNHLALVAFGAILGSEYSIIQDDTADVLETFNDSGQATFVDFDCNVLHETQSLNNANLVINNLASTAVDFVAPDTGDYHILPSSVAVDFCDDSIAWPQDIDGDIWGYDDPKVINVNGAFDAGADETYSSDIIFKNGY